MLDTSAASSFPWTAVVGIAGIAGTLLGSYLTNRAAEKRLLLEQAHNDRTRFHKERAELYGRLLSAAQACISAAIDIKRLTPDKRKEFAEQVSYPPFEEAVRGLTAAKSAVQLVASHPVRKAADEVVWRAVKLALVAASGQEDKFQDENRRLDEFVSAFAASARDELLPKEKAAP